jgi:uncharacterized membrane-anchored protein
MLNKVPEVTALFWVIKVLGTTVGETAADYLNETLKLGLTRTTVIAATALLVALIAQFAVRRYIPAIYWTVVILISIVGTLITDNLTDNIGIRLEVTTAVFAVVLAVVFGSWYAVEHTLSIHTITTTRREAFYWLAILCTFAFGTAAGDLVSERFGLGYWEAGLIFGGLIAVVAVAYFRFRISEVLAFWAAYILTRPLGASFGDYLTQSRSAGGLGLSTNGVSLVFLVLIVASVARLTVRERRSATGAPDAR